MWKKDISFCYVLVITVTMASFSFLNFALIVRNSEKILNERKTVFIENGIVDRMTLLGTDTNVFSRMKRRNPPNIINSRLDIRCDKLIKGNESEIQKALQKMKIYQPEDISEIAYINETKNCQNFIQNRGYIFNSVSKEEEKFSIAYSIVMYRDICQAERLLRAIYRPQNVYCIHVDKSANYKVRETMDSISKCFDNVFIASRTVKVQWGQFSLLEPELICMRDLWYRKVKWKYFINLTGHEFPLKTNFELVKILKAYDGANDVEGTIKRANIDRWNKVGPAPHGIQPTKGNVHVAVNRKFADFVLHNQTAKDFLEWVKQTQVPDETFFSTLNHNPQLGISGSYIGEPETDTDKKPFLARFINWSAGLFKLPCRGKWRNSVCVFGIGDLQVLTQRKEMFANKLFWNYQPFTLDCLEEWHRNKTIDDFKGNNNIDIKYYENLHFVKSKVS